MGVRFTKGKMLVSEFIIFGANNNNNELREESMYYFSV
jgi:hypothetical protein